MYLFSDVDHTKVERLTESFSAIEEAMDATGAPRSPAGEALCFAAVTRSLSYLQSGTDYDTTQRKFVDAVGSRGLAAAAAAMVGGCREVYELETCGLNSRCSRKLFEHLGLTNARATSDTFVTANISDADIVYYNTWRFGDLVDEGVLVAALEKRVARLQCGSFLVLVTRWDHPLVQQNFKLLFRSTITVEEPFVIWLYQTQESVEDPRVSAQAKRTSR